MLDCPPFCPGLSSHGSPSQKCLAGVREPWLNEQNRSGWARLTAPGSFREGLWARTRLWEVRSGQRQMQGSESQI